MRWKALERPANELVLVCNLHVLFGTIFYLLSQSID
jgi:hypothetical protein